MKTIILTLVLFFLHLTNISAQWEIINDGSDLKGYLNTIDFVNEDIGWIAGQGGTLLKTTDGGENWNSVPVNESWQIYHIDFITESTGWAIGRSGTHPNYTYPIWKSSDSGQTWLQQYSSTTFGFSSLYAIDENNVYAAGSNKIYKTTNGGTNWLNVSPNLPDREYFSVWFQDSQTGVVVGTYSSATGDKGCVLKTTNGGTNWNEIILDNFNSIYDLQFLDLTNGYFRAHKDTTHYICKTDNILNNWTVKTQHPYSISSYQFLNNNTAYAIMDDSISSFNVMKTVDGGNTWNKISPGAKGLPIGKIYFNKSNSGIILSAREGWGTPGDFSFPALFVTSDSGENCKMLRYNLRLNNLSFVNTNRGLIIGGRSAGGHYNGYGVILSTSDQGNNWEIKYYGLSLPFRECILVNQSIGLILSVSGGAGASTIFKTTDFGDNWLTIPTPAVQGYICFFNDQIGWIVSSAIFKTSDGGNNWELEWTNPIPGVALKSIHFTSNIGWSVGESGMIVKYTPQTGWIQQPSVTDLPLNKVFFSDENHGWIAGGYQNENNFQNILLKTTNGGVNWASVPNIPYLFRDIAFVDNNLGWAIGYDSSGVGGILKTTDGGFTWEINSGNLPAQLNALHIKDNYGWAVGENGLILRTTDAGAVWVEDESDNSLPTEFVLEQNYPNPFNPGTVIRYSLSVNSFVSLKVYDVLGREIKTLVNQEQPAGSYEVQLTINDEPLTSGIYLYRLTAGSYTSTKKMLLLK